MATKEEKMQQAYEFGQQIAKKNWLLSDFKDKYKDNSLQKRMVRGYLDAKADQLSEAMK